MSKLNLREKKCLPCEGGTLPLMPAAAEELLKELMPEWRLVGEKKIERRFQFAGFKQALTFVNQVAELAETEGHHPDITINYNRVTLTLTTHAIGGLSENDFILASKIDSLPYSADDETY